MRQHWSRNFQLSRVLFNFSYRIIKWLCFTWPVRRPGSNRITYNKDVLKLVPEIFSISSIKIIIGEKKVNGCSILDIWEANECKLQVLGSCELVSVHVSLLFSWPGSFWCDVRALMYVLSQLDVFPAAPSTLSQHAA